jgi:uroporphyrinogen-III synthase
MTRPDRSALKPKPLVWVTRAQPGADATAERLKAAGFEAIVAPVLEVRPVPDREIDLSGVGALAFTSANAVTAFAALRPERDLAVFAVGDATAEAARRCGFAEVTSAKGDARALAAMLAAGRGKIAGVVLYGAAAEPSVDLRALLANEGVAVRQVPLYETAPLPAPQAVIARLPEIDAVLVHSARAARSLADMLSVHAAPRLAAFCLSAQVAAALGDARLGLLVTAAGPTEAQLLSLLSSRFAPSSGTRT